MLTADLQPLEEADGLTVPAFELSPAVVSGLPANTVVLWQVEALRPGLAPLVSPTFSSRLQ